MGIAFYGKHTERAVNALLAKRAAEQRAKEAAEQAERNRRIEAERAEAERLKRIRLMELAQAELEKILEEESNAIVVKLREPLWKPTQFEIIKARAKRVFKVTEADLVGPRRSKRVMPARLFVYYWAARRTKLSLPQIGKRLGGRDHTSCISGKRRYVDLRAKSGRNLRPV